MKMIKKILILLAVLLVAPAFGQDIPERPDPPRLVNDFAGVLDAGQAAQLEEQLSAYARQTTTQIVILTGSYTGWIRYIGLCLSGRGEMGESDRRVRDNGVIIVFKPKTAGRKRPGICGRWLWFGKCDPGCRGKPADRGE
ncbi:MAG: TPM domain-containing protein [Mangrovibacterium sp.]